MTDHTNPSTARGCGAPAVDANGQRRTTAGHRNAATRTPQPPTARHRNRRWP